MRRTGERRADPTVVDNSRDKMSRELLLENYLKEWRLRRGFTQEQLAADADTTHATISRLENDETWFKHKTIIGILEALHITAADLFGRNPNDPHGIWEMAEQLNHLSPARRQTAFSILETLLREEKQNP